MGFLIIILFVATWILAWFPDGPQGPVFRFGLESNTGIFVANTIALIIFVSAIAIPISTLMKRAESARKEAGARSRLEWYGFTYVWVLITGASFSAFSIYLTGESSGFTYGIENDFIRWILKSIIISIFLTPIFMWHAVREDRQKNNDGKLGIFERIGRRAGQYLGKRLRRSH